MMGLIAVALHLVINHSLRNFKTSKFGAFNKVMAGDVNAEIVINGSSRALSHYDPIVIERITGRSAYNIGMNASQIDVELAVLKTYLKHNAKPKLVIQNLDLFSFEATKKGEIYDPGYFVPYLYEPELYEPLRRIDPVVWKWKYIPLYGYTVDDMRFTWISALLGCIGIHGREDYYQGFNPREGTWNRDFDQYKIQNRKGVKFEIQPAGIQSMEEVIRLCKSRDISFVLAYSPEYYEMQDMEINRREIIDKFVELSKRFGVPFWDYSDSELSHRQDLFQNSQHLNARGAAAFSEDLARRLADGSIRYNAVEFRSEHAEQKSAAGGGGITSD